MCRIRPASYRNLALDRRCWQPNRLLLARTVAVHVTFVLGMAGVPNSSVHALPLLYRETASHAGRPNWFVVHGETAFILPEGRDKAFARVMFGKEPKGWTLASDLDGTTSIGVLRDGLMIGGAGYHVAVRAVERAPLRFVYPESLPGIAAPMRDEIVRVAAAERAFWRDPAEPFFVCLIPLTDSSEYAGRGLYRGFAIYLGAGVSRDVWLHLFAHEHMHTWISRRIGGFPKIKDDLEAWLNEAFTEAETARVLQASKRT